MTLTVLFAAGTERWDAYRAPLQEAFLAKGLDADLVQEADPSRVDYIIYAPGSPLQDFRPFTRTRAVLNIWAGVERIVGNPTLTQPLCRMVDPSLTEGMVEWVAGQVLRHHLGLDTHILHQDGIWRHDLVPPLARDRPVAVLGMGALGQACGQALAGLGFAVTGWSRGARAVSGLVGRFGEAGLRDALTGAQIVVLLLPLTPDTENLINAERLGWLHRGAVLINPGRGALIDDAALLAALDSGQVGHATLDVFRTEPLPADHPFWAHPRVTVTPHIAAETRPETAAVVIAENIRRSEAGEALLHVVDRQRGY
ncbi:MAG: glyoxylate/hydroxypyruvate reductase A [Rhodobacteraceae bacterium]|nr:glyoxylate/hydroxypyruvate reductase A [Paracoccaceae bacterium]